MKYLIFILLVTFTSTFAFAEENIILQNITNNDEGGWVRDNRSSSIAPIASHDGNVVTIYSEKTLEDVSIYVVDVYGGILYSMEESTLIGNYTFTLDGNPKGTLTLVIQTSEGYYEGEFSLE